MIVSATYAQTTTSISIHLSGDSPVFGESSVVVSLDDEGAGLFIALHQPQGGGQINLDYDQLLLVADAAKMLMEGVEPEGET